MSENIFKLHQELINRKYMGGLNTAEEKELARIESELESLEAPFYEPIITRIQAKVR